jgi:aminopeptidase N
MSFLHAIVIATVTMGLGGSVHHTEAPPYTFDATIVRLQFDLRSGTVYGDEAVVVRPTQTASVLPFHSHQIAYQRVVVNGHSAPYTIDKARDTIDVQLPSPVPAHKQVHIEFHYSAQPQRGLFFVRPDHAYPHVIPEIWTQGEPTDNRRWFPTWDEPNAKTPSELIVRVPRGWTVVGNGVLKSHTHDASTDTWDWNSPRPKSTYLIAFAAGPFVRVPDTLGALAVDGFVAPGQSNLGALCFRRTPDMIAYYERITGVPYPFEKFDQIAVERFTAGGMEDSSNTILSDRFLHTPGEDVEDSCDGVVSHELAQNWYGDDATTVDWSNIWLNEGFATYYDELWTGERFGVPDFEYARYLAQQRYFAETKRYMRPIVDYTYADPLQLFDASGHERPAAVLHMLRTMFGDARFFRAVDAYLREYAYRNADTHQFFAAMSTSLGTDLTWFESEWFYRASYPHYYVSDRYDAATHTLLLHVEQHNPDGQPFRVPIVIEAFVGPHVARREVTIDRAVQDITIPNVVGSPDMVLFDPDANMLKKLTFPKTVTQLAYQLAHAAHVGDREWALQQLAAFQAGKSAVAHAVVSDPFWGVRADAVDVAASFDDANAVHDALHDIDPRVRIAAEVAAGSLRSPAAIAADLETMTNDPDPDIVGAALTTLGVLHIPGASERLTAALDRPSFHETIAAGALAGIAADCDERAFTLIKARTVYGTPEIERNAAVEALAQCARRLKKPELAMGELVDLATHDPLIRTRLAAVDALGTLHDAAAVPTLERVERSDTQETVRETAERALAATRGPKQ